MNLSTPLTLETCVILYDIIIKAIGVKVPLNRRNLPFLMTYLILIQKKLDVNGEICRNLDKYFEFTKNHRKKLENEYESQHKTIEISNKMKKQSMSTVSLVNYP